jgi:glycerol-3-phosphate dehydrogenase
MVAWTEEDAARLPAIMAKSHANGVSDVRPIGLDELYRREPNLARTAKAAIAIPGEHVIDPWSAPLAYALQAIANGAEIRRNCMVQGGRLEDGVWQLETNQGPVHARVVVNCAGLYGDIVEAICRTSPFTVTPRKGQFIVFDKPAARLVSATILAVPNERTKGVLLARTAFGNLLLGPTAEDQTERARAAVDSRVLAELVRRGSEILPALSDSAITATFAGLRPATQHADYQIEAIAERRWITVGGIRSTGLTGSLGIARHVLGLYQEHFGHAEELINPRWVRVPNLCEARPRPYQSETAGEIVCHCEGVTRAEIDAALGGPLPARDLGGLRRRTRCMMGRCQGFYCTGRIAALTTDRLGPPIVERIAS